MWTWSRVPGVRPRPSVVTSSSPPETPPVCLSGPVSLHSLVLPVYPPGVGLELVTPLESYQPRTRLSTPGPTLDPRPTSSLAPSPSPSPRFVTTPPDPRRASENNLDLRVSSPSRPRLRNFPGHDSPPTHPPRVHRVSTPSRRGEQGSSPAVPGLGPTPSLPPSVVGEVSTLLTPTVTGGG